MTQVITQAASLPSGLVRALFLGHATKAAFLPFPRPDAETQETIEEVDAMVRAWAEEAIDAAAIENLRAQEAEKGFRERSRKAGAFFGEGKTGGWRDKLNPEQVAKIVTDHGEVMRRLGYLDDAGNPV